MKKYIFITIATLFLNSIVACSDSQETQTYRFVDVPAPSPTPVPHPSEAEVKESSNIMIGGETPQEFYKHFYYRSFCAAKNSWYSYAGASDFYLGIEVAKQTMKADLSLVIKKDGTYTAYYAERIYRGFGKNLTVDHLPVRIFTRHWTIKGRQILFEGLGLGTPYKSFGVRGILLNIQRNVIREDLNGMYVNIGIQVSGSSPSDEVDGCALN